MMNFIEVPPLSAKDIASHEIDVKGKTTDGSLGNIMPPVPIVDKRH